MPPIVGLGKDAIQMAHALTQISIRRLHQQVVMIVHQTVGVTGPVELIDDSGKDITKGFAVGVIIKNNFPSIAPRGEVIQCVEPR